MKKLLIALLVFLAISITGSAQEKITIAEGSDRTSRVENYLFLYDYFGEDFNKTKKYWNEMIEKDMKMIIFINLTSQTLDVIDMRDTFKIAIHDTISSGMKAHPTPVGNWKICNKKVNFWSTSWGCNMRYWNGLEGGNSFGMHGLEGYAYEKQLGKAVSHGCIRLRRSLELTFYQLVPIGTKVVIYGRPPWETYGRK